MSSLNDDYWNTSSTSKFNFDDEDLSASQIDSVANDVFSSKLEETNIFAIEFIISKKCLDLLLADTDNENTHVVHSVEAGIRRMVLGQRVVLEVYKSYKEKLLLLDEALKTHNGDIILKVTDFVRRTLKFNIFCGVIAKRKAALLEYSNLLKMQGDMEELENLYMATGFTSNIRDLYFLNTRSGANKQDTLNRLKCFISSHSHYLTCLNETKWFSYYTKYLEWQIINEEDSGTIIDQLAVICRKQWEQNANEDDPINLFKTLFKIDDAQFEWTVLNCLCFIGSWKKLIGMFVKTNWFTKRNGLKTSINQEDFVWGVAQHDPPKTVLEQLLSCLSDPEKSLVLAEKFQCHKFMIEYYTYQRDRIGLLKCMDKVTLNSEEYYIIKKALESQDKKWKN